MNEIVEHKVNRQVADTMTIGSRGINFDNAAQVMEYAKMMAASGSAVPKHLRGQPGACLGIINDAIAFGINPYPLARKSYFVNDTLAYEAQVLMAIVNASPALKVRPDIRWEGEGLERRCIVTGTFRDGAQREYKSPRFADIHPKNSPLWKSDPDQQHSYYSLRAFARRWCPEVILGIFDIDEVRDAAMIDVTERKADEAQPAAPKGIVEALEQFASSGVPLSAGTVEGGGEGLQQASAAADASGSPAANLAGEGGDESPHPPASPSSPPQDPDKAFRDGAIAEALQIASRADLDADDRLERIDDMRARLLDRLSAEFVKALVETAVKVVQKGLKPDQAKRYLQSLK